MITFLDGVKGIHTKGEGTLRLLPEHDSDLRALFIDVLRSGLEMGLGRN